MQCQCCGKELEGYRDDAKFCSIKCRSKYKRDLLHPPIKTECKSCGKVFETRSVTRVRCDECVTKKYGKWGADGKMKRSKSTSGVTRIKQLVREADKAGKSYGYYVADERSV